MQELAIMACIFGSTALFAIVAWWRNRRVWWASAGVLASGAGIELYLPIRNAFHTPSGGFEPVGDGFGIFAEFVVLGGLLFMIHVALLFTIALLEIETRLEQKKAGAPEGQK